MRIPSSIEQTTKEENSTPFEHRIDCVIVSPKLTSSVQGKSMLVWTDGLGTRFNFPVDLYIDTTNTIDWQKHDPCVTVTVQCGTIRDGFIASTQEIRRANLFLTQEWRGLILLPNIFRIDPGNGIVHEVGLHQIQITISVADQVYRTELVFQTR